MNGNEADRFSLLEAQCAHLTEEKGLAMNALEMAANLSHFHTSVQGGEDSLALLAETASKVRSLIPFKSLSFYLIDEADADFRLAYCDPSDHAQRIERETETLINDQMFAWALGRNKPVTVSAANGIDHLLLHAMSTPSRTRAMFIGVLDKGHDAIPDISFTLLSIILLSSAGVLESFEVYRYIKSINLELQENVRKLADSEKKLLNRRRLLEEEVKTRTLELTRSNELLKKEIGERARAERDLLRERDFIAAVLDTSTALVLVLDRQGRIVRFNRACEVTTGYTADEVLDQPFWDIFIVPAEREALKAYFRGITSNTALLSHENRLLTKDGANRLIAWSNSVLAGAENEIEYVIATGIDITEKKSAEEALRDSEARFRAVFTEAGIGIAVHSVAGAFIDCNPVFCKMVGYLRDELIGRNFSLVNTPEDAPLAKEALDRLLAGEPHVGALEKRYRKKDGGLVWGRLTRTIVRNGYNSPLYIISMVEDITNRKLMEDALRDAEETYRTIFENAVEGIFQAFPRGPYSKANPAMARMLDYASSEELIAEAADFTRHMGLDKETEDAFYQALAEQGAVTNVEMQAQRRDERMIWISMSARAVFGPTGAIARIEGLAEDVTDRKVSEIHLQRKATYDELTGIPNRFLFLDRFEQTLAQAKRMGHRLVLMYIDLDEFKNVNDSHGHHIGDKVLIEAAERLKERVRRSDTLARLGGDEFTIILSDVAMLKDAEKVAKEIIASLSKPYLFNGIECVIGASVGASVYPQHGATPDELMKKADAAMYKAKRSGGNAYRLFEPGMSFKRQ